MTLEILEFPSLPVVLCMDVRRQPKPHQAAINEVHHIKWCPRALQAGQMHLDTNARVFDDDGLGAVELGEWNEMH